MCTGTRFVFIYVFRVSFSHVLFTPPSISCLWYLSEKVRALELLFTLFDVEGLGLIKAHDVAIALRSSHSLPSPQESNQQALNGDPLLPLDQADISTSRNRHNKKNKSQVDGTMDLSAIVSATELSILVRRFEMGCRWNAEVDEEVDIAAEAAELAANGGVPASFSDAAADEEAGEEKDNNKRNTAGAGAGGGEGTMGNASINPRKAREAGRRERFADALIDETQFILAFRDIVM